MPQNNKLKSYFRDKCPWNRVVIINSTWQDCRGMFGLTAWRCQTKTHKWMVASHFFFNGAWEASNQHMRKASRSDWTDLQPIRATKYLIQRYNNIYFVQNNLHSATSLKLQSRLVSNKLMRLSYVTAPFLDNGLWSVQKIWDRREIDSFSRLPCQLGEMWAGWWLCWWLKTMMCSKSWLLDAICCCITVV